MADFVVSLTRKGRELEAQQLLYGYGFQINFFVLGAGGHDPADPTLALPLDTDVETLPGQFFGPEPIDNAELLNPTCPRFTCVVQPGEAVGGISNLGLMATIVSVPAAAPGPPARVCNVNISDPALVVLQGHGFLEGDTVVFATTGTLPTGLEAGQQYYVRNPEPDRFNVATTPTGDLVVTSGTQAGVQTVRGYYYQVGDMVLYAEVNFPLRYHLSSSRETFSITIRT